MFHDSENGFSLQFGVERKRNFGASMEATMEKKKKRKSKVEERKELLKFLKEEREDLGFL